jgi:SAM-dependent methyltransferase
MNRLHRWLCRSAAWKRALERTLLPWALDGVALGDDVLEIGPGPGLTTDLLRARVARMTALEIDARLATALSRRLAGSNVRVVEGDATRMPFDDGAFSSVVSLTMLHHVPSPALQDRVFGQAFRVLRPGGVFAGTDSTPSLAFRLLHVGDTMVTVDPGALAARHEAAR